MLTGLMAGGNDPMVEDTGIAISSIADTWIHLSFVVQGGERNRALTIIKSRGTKHSSQVRELILSDQGVTIAEVYSAEGEEDEALGEGAHGSGGEGTPPRRG